MSDAKTSNNENLDEVVKEQDEDAFDTTAKEQVDEEALI